MTKTKKDKLAILRAYLMVCIMLTIAFISGYMVRSLLVKAYGIDYSILSISKDWIDQYQELFATIGIIINFIFILFKVYKGVFTERKYDRS